MEKFMSWNEYVSLKEDMTNNLTPDKIDKELMNRPDVLKSPNSKDPLRDGQKSKEIINTARMQRLSLPAAARVTDTRRQGNMNTGSM